jgi:hypothetical protein
MRAEDVKSITFLVSGKPVMFNLADNPVITYSNNCLVIVTSKTTVLLNVSEIESTTFSAEDATGIKGIAVGNMKMTSGTASFFQLSPGSTVRVFTTAGELLREEQASADGTATIEMRALPEGIYIIKTENQSIKIINK